MGTLIPAASLAVALAALAALWPRDEPRALLVDRDPDEVQVFLRLPAETVLDALGATEEGARLGREIVAPDGRLDTARVQDLKVEIVDALLPRLALRVGGEATALEPIGLLAHPVEDAAAFDTPLDAWRSIGVCLAPEGAPRPAVGRAVMDLGVVAWPVEGSAALDLAVDLPGAPGAMSAFAKGRPLPHHGGPDGWRVPGLAP